MPKISTFTITTEDGIDICFSKEIGITIKSKTNPFSEEELEYFSNLYKILLNPPSLS